MTTIRLLSVVPEVPVTDNDRIDSQPLPEPVSTIEDWDAEASQEVREKL